MMGPTRACIRSVGAVSAAMGRNSTSQSRRLLAIASSDSKRFADNIGVELLQVGILGQARRETVGFLILA